MRRSRWWGNIAGRVYFGHADQIARLDEAPATAGVHFTTELYEGAAHCYTARDAAGSYDAEATELHYKRLLMVLEETLQ